MARTGLIRFNSLARPTRTWGGRSVNLDSLVDGLFDEAFGSLWGSPRLSRGIRHQVQASAFPMDARLGEKELTLYFDLPGVKLEDIELDLKPDGRTLVVKATRHAVNADEEQELDWQERRFGSVSRELRLPAGVNGEGAQASLKDGVLEVVLQRELPQSTKIPVSAA